MTSITIADLDNAKVDVDTIAEIATSLEDTAIDRLGNTKLTMTGVVNSMRALTPRGAWATATSYDVRDLVTQGGIVYIVTESHVSGTFATDLAAGKLAVYQGAVGNDLSDTSDLTKGDALIGVKLNATGAVGRTQHAKNAERVSVFDFMTIAEISDVQARTVTIDVRTKIQAAFDYVKTRGGTLIFPPGRYYISGYIGNDQINASDFADNTTLHFESGAELYLNPNYAIPSGTWYWHAISLEGNNIAITGAGKITSNQTLLWNGDLPAQRTNYLIGIVGGGKSYGRITPAVGQERTGFRVQGMTIDNFHLPLVAYAASQVRFFDNTITNDTDTGILIDNCLEDIEVAYNRCVNSGDDHIFCRHYVSSPWAVAGRYVGNYRVHHNHCTNTFAKFIGFGGIADVDCHDNYGNNCWFAGINFEVDTTWYDNNRRIQVHHNILRDCGRAWDPAHPVPTYRVPVTDTTVTCGVLLTTSPASWPLKRFEHVQIHDNLIVNPQSHGITVITALGVDISNNKLIPSVVTRSAVNYPTTGSAFYLSNVNRVSVNGNVIDVDSGGTTFPHGYELDGDAITSRVRIVDNPREEFGTALFVPYNATIGAQVTYRGTAISTSQSWAGSAVPSGGVTTVVLSVAGARMGDLVSISYTQHLGALTLTGYVNADDQVAATLSNTTGGIVTPAAGSFKVICQRRGL